MPLEISNVHLHNTTYMYVRMLSSIAITLHRKFDHPNIVKILAVCVDNDPVYIIMELMPAGDLLKFLREAHPESVSYKKLHVYSILVRREEKRKRKKRPHLMPTMDTYVYTYTCKIVYIRGARNSKPLVPQTASVIN